MKSTLDIDVASFYNTQFKRLKWILEDETASESAIRIEEESTSDKSEIRQALEEHIDHISNALPEGRLLHEYEVTLSFGSPIQDEKKEEFTKLFNEFNTRDEST